jgi:hypothetical protein
MQNLPALTILPTMALLLTLGTPGSAQDPSVPPRKLKAYSEAYNKAVDYTIKNLSKASFPAKMVIGWLLLADGRFPQELETVINLAVGWDKQRYGDHAKNWFPALAGILLSEYYRHYPTEEVKAALQGIADHFVKFQEANGGWFKWFEGAVKDMPKYPVRTLGILDGTVLGFLYGAKKLGCKVPETTLKKGEECMSGILGPRGISYGTGQRGGDTTGARGGLAMLGLDIAGMHSHSIWTTYVKLIPNCVPNMDKGHHIGAFHCLGLTLAAWKLGHHGALLNEWGPKLSKKQDPDGGVFVGDDGADGGEAGLLRGNHGSTAAFALMLLLQDSTVLKPKGGSKKGDPAGGGGGGGGGGAGSGSGNPFSRKKPAEEVPTQDPKEKP